MNESAPKTSHRLQLPRATAPQDVLAMIRNVQPEAQLVDGRIALRAGAALVQDDSPRGAGRWDLQVERVRTDPPAEGMTDPSGYSRAFPDGLPFGVERESLDLALALARRLFGAVVTDSGTRLEPLPHHERDLIVTSPHRVDVESLLAMLQTAEPGLEHVSGDDESHAVMFSVDVGPDHLDVRLGPSQKPVALAQLDWLDRAVDYEIVHIPADDSEEAIELPDEETSARWTDAYTRVGRLAGVLVENLGGYVTDRHGFLVDPADLV